MVFVSVFFFLLCLFFSISLCRKSEPASVSSLFSTFQQILEWLGLSVFVLVGTNLARRALPRTSDIYVLVSSSDWLISVLTEYHAEWLIQFAYWPGLAWSCHTELGTTRLRSSSAFIPTRTADCLRSWFFYYGGHCVIRATEPISTVVVRIGWNRVCYMVSRSGISERLFDGATVERLDYSCVMFI